MIEKIKSIMENPNRRYGVYPIIHHRVLSEGVVEQMDDCGFAGVVANIEYRRHFDTEDTVWLETEKKIREYIKRGMHVWLYDEDGYPSGVASGYLTEKYPEHIAKGLYCYEYWRTLKGPRPYRSDVPADKLWRAVLVSVDGEKIVDVTDGLNENNVLYFDIPEGEYYFIMMSIRRLFDRVHPSESWSTPRNYINLFDRKATERFIEMTHERYKKFLSDEFGRGILATFTDEPSLIAWCLTGNLKDDVYPYLLWSEELVEKFEKKYGYDFLSACIALLKPNLKGAAKMRCDYWNMIADGVAEGYFKPIQDWCRENNLKSSGHFIGEELLSIHVLGYGSFFRSMRHLDWPGIDMLYTTPDELMDETKIPVGRFVASVADISGENEVFTEYSDLTFKVNGTTAGPDVYYGSANWHLALGVNNFTSYFSFKDVSPEEKRKYNKYVARCGEIMRIGVRDCNTAVYYPETDMWANFTMSAEYAHTSKMGGEDFVKIQEDYCNLTWALLHRQVDFDYVDPKLLIKSYVEDGALVINGRRYYDFIISSFKVVDDAVAARVIEMAKAGVKVHILRGECDISAATGERSKYKDEIMNLIADGKIFADSDGDVKKMLDGHFDSWLIKTDSPQNRLLTHCRITDDGNRIIFAANMGYDEIKDTLAVREECKRLYRVDPDFGCAEEMPFVKTQSGETRFSLDIGGIKANIYVLEK